MKRLTTTEKSAVVVGVAFVVLGASTIIYPTEGIVSHSGTERGKVVLRPTQPIYASKKGSQIFGGIAVVVGASISWLALYRGKD